MGIGDLVRNIATGDLAVVTGVGGDEAKMWVTLNPTKNLYTRRRFFGRSPL